MFAKECLLYNLPQDYIDNLKNNPLKEMTDIQKVRQILESLFFTKTFPAAFDLQTKKIHFYVRFDDAKNFALDNTAGITLADIQNTTNQSVFDQFENKERDLTPDVILMNFNFPYLRKHVMIDCEETSLSDTSSFTVVALGGN